MEFNKSVTLSDLAQLFPAECLISGGDYFTAENRGLSLADLNRKNPTWNPEDIIFGLNRLSAAAPQRKTFFYIEEGSSPNLIYLPADEKSTKPFAILLAGGAYGAVCTLVESLPVAAVLNSQGIDCFCLNYRTATPADFSGGLMPKPVDDIDAALRFIRNSPAFHTEKRGYIICGFSAGGNAAAIWGTEHLGAAHYGAEKPLGAVLAYPLLTMGNLPESPVKKYICTGLYGACYSNKDIDKYSVPLHVSPDYPQTYIIRADDDPVVPKEDADSFEAACKSVGVRCLKETIPTGMHGFGRGSGTAAEGWTERALHFLDIL